LTHVSIHARTHISTHRRTVYVFQSQSAPHAHSLSLSQAAGLITTSSGLPPGCRGSQDQGRRDGGRRLFLGDREKGDVTMGTRREEIPRLLRHDRPSSSSSPPSCVRDDTRRIYTIDNSHGARTYVRTHARMHARTHARALLLPSLPPAARTAAAVATAVTTISLCHCAW